MRRSGLALILLVALLAGCTAPEEPLGPRVDEMTRLGPSGGQVVSSDPLDPAQPLPAPIEVPAIVIPDWNGTTDPGPAPEPEPVVTQPAPAPPPRAEKPWWRDGTRFEYRGMNETGAPYVETLTVLTSTWVRGLAVYVVNATHDNFTRDDFGRERWEHLNFTVQGANLLDRHGNETELLRFPMTVGDAWGFGHERREFLGNDSYGGWLETAVKASVRVVAYENVTTAAGEFQAFHLVANITMKANTTSTWLDLDYWYAPQVQAIARMEARSPLGLDWSELTAVRRP